MKCCVYRILNIATGDFYIGSTKNIDNRKRSHKYLLRIGKHCSKKMQEAFNNEQKLVFQILIRCKPDERLKLEQFYLDELKPIYNTGIYSDAPMKGRKHSDETIQKMSGRKAWNKGIPRTVKELENIKIGIKLKRKPPSLKTRMKIAKWHKENSYWRGKRIPDDVRKKISESYPKCPVVCSNGKIYRSQLDAAKELGVKQGHIAECLSGERNNIKQLQFWKPGEEHKVEKLRPVLRKKIKTSTGLFFNSITECAQFYDTEPAYICSRLKGKTKSALNGVYFEYDNEA